MPAKPPRVPQIVEQDSPKRNKTSPPTPTLPVRRAHVSYRPPFCAMQGYYHLFLLHIVRLSAVMRPILEPCEHPQCEQNASPPRIGLPQELQGPRRGPRNRK